MDGKALRVRQTLIFEDRNGTELLKIQERVARVRATMEIEDPGGYTIEDGRSTVAEVSKKWFRVADTYGVEVAPGQNPALMLAVTAVLDQMAHEAR